MSLPTVECRGLCWTYCRPFRVTAEELGLIEVELGAKVPVTPTPEGRYMLEPSEGSPSCPLLGPTGLCTVYPSRPMVCRIFGVSEGMECPYGCVPKTPIPRQMGLALLRRGLRAQDIR